MFLTASVASARHVLGYFWRKRAVCIRVVLLLHYDASYFGMPFAGPSLSELPYSIRCGHYPLTGISRTQWSWELQPPGHMGYWLPGPEGFTPVIFALWDYWNYRRQRGRYAREYPAGIMAGAWMGDLPAAVKQHLLPGDFLLVEGMGSSISWLVMYITSSKVSHVTTVVDNERIVHSTLGGVRFDSIDSLFDKGSRVLPIRCNFTEEERLQLVDIWRSQIGNRYGLSSAVRKGLRILIGRDWAFFRWRLAADICIPLILFTVIILPFGGTLWLMYACLLYLVSVAGNAALWRLLPPKYDEHWAKPCDVINDAYAYHYEFIVDAANLHRAYGVNKKIS